MFSERMIEVSFGDHPFEAFLSTLQNGQTVSGAALLTLLDGESEDVLEEVFTHLADMGVTLDITDLPVYPADSETALRLRTEAQLAKSGDLMRGLSENDPLKLYLQELAQIPVCGDLAVLTQALAAANRRGDTQSPVQTQVMDLCLSRVVELAQEYAGRGVLLMDLIQEGSMGLWQGICCYEDTDFEAYRDCWIRWSMDKAVITQAHAMGVGQKLRQALEDYRSVDEKLLAELGRNPTLEEIAQALHISAAEAETVAAMLQNARMLQRAKTPEPEQLPQEEDQAVEDTAYFQMRQRISELLSGLSEEDAKLLRLRYGLEGGLPLDPGQAGQQLGMTAQEVLDRESAALARLRNQ